MHETSGLCVQDCSTIDPDLENDEKNQICRKRCETGEYNHPTKADQCLECEKDGRIWNCVDCDWKSGIGSNLVCIECDDGFTPALGGCARANCKEFSSSNL